MHFVYIDYQMCKEKCENSLKKSIRIVWRFEKRLYLCSRNQGNNAGF